MGLELGGGEFEAFLAGFLAGDDGDGGFGDAKIGGDEFD